ncbi:MAG: hypothetical protein ACT4PM_12835 [Gemmatimonadales bacterium]
MRFVLMSGALVLAACRSSSGPAPVTPVSSAQEAVRAFMNAAADSNLTRMGELWGTERGLAAKQMAPADHYKRLVVMQAYLKGDSIRVVSETPVRGRDNERDLVVELYRLRGACVKSIPFNTVRAGSGTWLVQSVNVGAAGNPAHPCDGGR